MVTPITTNFQIIGADIGPNLVTKEYLIDVYPTLADTFRFAGLWGWGDNSFNSYGPLGDNTIISKSSPIQTIAGGANWKQVSVGCVYAAAIKTDGTLWLWGSNDYGYLGNNSTIRVSSPIQTVAGGTNWKQVSVSPNSDATNVTGAIKTDGTLWLWGYNFYGQLGNNSTTSLSSPVQTVAAGTNWKQVSIGGHHTAAIKTDGTLWTWGSNSGGELGDNTLTSRSSPIQTVAGGTNWKQVSKTSAIKNDGTLWNWGSWWNLGDGTTASKSSPVQTVAAGTNWKQVSSGSGGGAVLAIKTDGTLWGWGLNYGGTLGNNSTTNISSPIQTVAGGTNWKQVAADNSAAAIKTDGTLWLWGYNSAGGLGDNTIVDKSSPVQTISGGTNWKQVDVCGYIAFAIRDNSSDIFGNPT